MTRHEQEIEYHLVTARRLLQEHRAEAAELHATIYPQLDRLTDIARSVTSNLDRFYPHTRK